MSTNHKANVRELLKSSRKSDKALVTEVRAWVKDSGEERGIVKDFLMSGPHGVSKSQANNILRAALGDALHVNGWPSVSDMLKGLAAERESAGGNAKADAKGPGERGSALVESLVTAAAKSLKDSPSPELAKELAALPNDADRAKLLTSLAPAEAADALASAIESMIVKAVAKGVISRDAIEDTLRDILTNVEGRLSASEADAPAEEEAA